MKTKTSSFLPVTLATALMLAGMPGYIKAGATGRPVTRIITGEEDPNEKSAKKNKTRQGSFSSNNNSSVKIYPDIIKREMHVVAKENEGREVDFFVFDLEGAIVQQHKMKAKDHVRMSGLTRGVYQYRVFCGDEETAAGQFEIR